MKIRGQIEAKPPYLKGNIDGALRVENFMDRA
jgi:hypothetical protein